jgi:hypothetical protein
MQTAHTFILKIMYNKSPSLALHGLLTSVSTGDQYPFADEQTLLDVLRRIISPGDLEMPAELAKPQPPVKTSKEKEYEP